MNAFQRLQNFLRTKHEDEDAQLTNGEIEDNIDRNDKPFIAFCMDYELRHDFRRGYGKEDLRLPLQEGFKAFTDIEELKTHIKRHEHMGRDKYFFDRNDEEVREAVLEAFRERRCEQLKREKKQAEQTLKEKKEKLEELDYCE